MIWDGGNNRSIVMVESVERRRWWWMEVQSDVMTPVDWRVTLGGESIGCLMEAMVVMNGEG